MGIFQLPALKALLLACGCSAGSAVVCHPSSGNGETGVSGARESAAAS